MPPTERRGRVHTSTITVAVLKNDVYKEVKINPSEVNVDYTKDSGPGGQHRNKTESCVVLTHTPTGIKVKNADSSSQHKNKADAWKVLTKRVNEFYKTGKIEETVEERRDQIGTGFRGDKIRTYRTKDDMVIDHVSNKTCSLKKFLRGDLDIIN